MKYKIELLSSAIKFKNNQEIIINLPKNIVPFQFGNNIIVYKNDISDLNEYDSHLKVNLQKIKIILYDEVIYNTYSSEFIEKITGEKLRNIFSSYSDLLKLKIIDDNKIDNKIKDLYIYLNGKSDNIFKLLLSKKYDFIKTFLLKSNKKIFIIKGEY